MNEQLSDLETAVLRALAAGDEPDEIARARGLDTEEVEDAAMRARRKLRARSVTQAVVMHTDALHGVVYLGPPGDELTTEECFARAEQIIADLRQAGH